MDPNAANSKDNDETESKHEDSISNPDLQQDQENVSENFLNSSENGGDPDVEMMRKRLHEMEEEAEKLRQLQCDTDKQSQNGTTGHAPFPTLEEKMEADQKSIYVGNVDYSATAQELETHFHGCGSINRVTVLCDKFTGQPKGFAYVEFTDKDSVQIALAMDDSLFKGRQIKVTAKRTNLPGVSSTDRPPRGSPSGYGRGRFSQAGAGYMSYNVVSYRGRLRRAMYRRRARTSYNFSPY